MRWNAARITTLRLLVDEGYTAEEIAEVFDVTKQSIESAKIAYGISEERITDEYCLSVIRDTLRKYGSLSVRQISIKSGISYPRVKRLMNSDLFFSGFDGRNGKTKCTQYKVREVSHV